jgi:hypothetical protein
MEGSGHSYRQSYRRITIYKQENIAGARLDRFEHCRPAREQAEDTQAYYMIGEKTFVVVDTISMMSVEDNQFTAAIVDGLLGADVLTQFDRVTFDLKAGILTLEK